MKRAILIGDSIRGGYEPVVKAHLSGLVDVWGPEANCSHTRATLEHLEEWVTQRGADVVHTNCGLHDMAREPGNPPGKFIYLEIGEYRQNVRTILERLLKETPAKIVWALTTPVSLERQHAFQYGVNRTPADVANYNAAARAVAEELGVRVHDLHRVVIQGGTERLLGEDGIHFTEDGYRVLGTAVAGETRQLL